MKKCMLSVAALATMISSTALGCSGQTDGTAGTSTTDEAGALSASTAATTAAAASADGVYTDGTYTGDTVQASAGEKSRYRPWLRTAS